MLGKLSGAVDGLRAVLSVPVFPYRLITPSFAGSAHVRWNWGGESGTDRNPTVYPGSYVEYVQKLGHAAPGIYS
jgi:hypothetical protein